MTLLRHEDGVSFAQTVEDHQLMFRHDIRQHSLPPVANTAENQHEAPRSVEAVHADFMTVDPDQVGRFDVVLFLGVLYHVREPLSALERVFRLTSEVAVIETEAIAVLGMPDATLIEFQESGALRGDYTNWFVPTEAALHALCKAAGFRRVVTRIGPPPRSRLLKSGARRMTERAPTDRRSRESSHPAVTRYRIAVHAYPAGS